MIEYLNDIPKFADEVMASIERVYAGAGLSLPQLRYITAGGIGDTVHDCEQVTISWEQSYTGLPGNPMQEMTRCDGPTTSVFVIEIVRCIPEATSGTRRAARSTPNSAVQPVNTSERSEAAYTQMRDAFLLREAGMAAGESDLLTTQGVLLDVSAGTPQGGYQGMLMTLAVAI